MTKGYSGWTDLPLCAGKGWLLGGEKMCHDLDPEEEILFSRKTIMGLSTISREIRTEDYKVPMLFKVPQKTNNQQVFGWTRASTRWSTGITVWSWSVSVDLKVRSVSM